jgi:uncharacterized lipoprotein YddW (UPF0748 family)
MDDRRPPKKQEEEKDGSNTITDHISSLNFNTVVVEVLDIKNTCFCL